MFFLLSGVVFIYFSLALVLSYLPAIPPPPSCPPNHEVFFSTNGVHLDVILPVECIEDELKKQIQIPEGIRFVSFGWGDRDFYIKTPEWSDLTFPVAFKALFLKSETAMHVTWLSRSYSGWKELKICDEQLHTLNRYIESSFQKNENGEFQELDFPGYTSDDVFFEATGSFTLFLTCNVWVNKALKETGVKTSVWSPFDFGVLHHLPE